METYESIKQLIIENADIINFGEFSQGVSKAWIKKAQDRLNVTFPPSYTWWLENYSGGEVLGEEIFSVYEMDFDEVVGGDIVYINELNRRNQSSNLNQLVIQETDRAEVFYFDLTKFDKNREYQVYLDFADYNGKYADNFLEFLAKRIRDIQ
ncbi:SMI1/KNR4 family protein [Mucilaginibacter flavidus]|uniref:SMI1/KNR4 family protein n=1 Tax=Mucilaginibacter flavidus TaxID=2949309 RepID=UPI0020927D1F|nr:SMI1/KNR4 family protein [Mucilaginibacter flavidus]MCO5950451.1 SMI1/KNR4 family protein [Mucilaginibacter flavidus]